MENVATVGNDDRRTLYPTLSNVMKIQLGINVKSLLCIVSDEQSPAEQSSEQK